MIIKPYPTSISLQALAAYCNTMRQQRCSTASSFVVGLTSGTFDMPHDFHVRYLMRCRRACNLLIVGVDSDAVVRATKGDDRPIMSEFQRVMLINAFSWVDAAYIQDSLNDWIHVTENVLGSKDKMFRNEIFADRTEDVARGHSQAQVVIIPDITELASTTALLHRVQKSAES